MKLAMKEIFGTDTSVFLRPKILAVIVSTAVLTGILVGLASANVSVAAVIGLVIGAGGAIVLVQMVAYILRLNSRISSLESKLREVAHASDANYKSLELALLEKVDSFD